MSDQKCPHDIAIEAAANAAVDTLRQMDIPADYGAILRFVRSLDHDQRVHVLAMIDGLGVVIRATLMAYSIAESDDDDSEPVTASGRMH